MADTHVSGPMHSTSGFRVPKTDLLDYYLDVDSDGKLKIGTGATGSNVLMIFDTVTGVNFPDALLLDEIATPANPSVGENKLYFKSDGNLYKLDDTGTEAQVGGGGGGADDLGNHTATQALNMAGFDITSASQFSVVTNSNTNATFNTDGSLIFDGAVFVGATSGPTSTLRIGTVASNATGIKNTSFGVLAGDALTTGREGTFIGFSAGTSITTGVENTFVGSNAGTQVTTTTGSTGVGSQALLGNAQQANTAVGARAGTSSTGALNIFIGKSAGKETTGSNNIILGVNVGFGGDIFLSAPNTSAEFIVGSRSAPILRMYIGEGANSPSPGSILISGTRGEGTDIAAGDFTLAGGAGTGTGAGGHLVFQTAPAGSTGETISSLVTRLEITDDAKIGMYGVSPVIQATDIGALTDSTGGSTDGTVSAISGSGADSDINNNFKELLEKYNSLRTLLRNLGPMA